MSPPIRQEGPHDGRHDVRRGVRRHARLWAVALLVPVLALGACGKRANLVRDPEPKTRVPAPMPAQVTPPIPSPEVKPARPIVHNPFGRDPL